jgi:hypothetical protein
VIAQQAGLPGTSCPARKRFFGSGELPVAPVIQSWLRCSQEGRRPDEKIDLERVSRSPLQVALQRAVLDSSSICRAAGAVGTNLGEGAQTGGGAVRSSGIR